MAEISTRPKTAATLTPRLQNYVSQSLAELTEKLVKCSREEKGQNLTSRTRDILYVLKAHKLRHSSNAHAFYGRRGVEALLALLSLCAGREGRDRGLLLATLGNLCALHGDCRSKVMSHGLSEVVAVLTQSHSPATLCTVFRLLANLALDAQNIPRLLEVGVVRELSHALFFQTGLDSACKLSIVRAVRLLSSSARCREEFKMSEGLPGLIDCLKSAEEKVAVSTLHSLHILLLGRDPDVIQALAANAGLPQVVRLCSHCDSDVARWAVEILVSCAKASEGRVGLSSAGGVECLLQQLEKLESTSDLFPAVATALCASCRDVLGRQRMRDSGGLERLIQMLLSSDLALLHGDILSALVCYYFDEHSLKFMVKRLGLLRALTYHLQQMTVQPSNQAEGGEGEEEGVRSVEQVKGDRIEAISDESYSEASMESEQEVGKEKTREETTVTPVCEDLESAEYSSPSPTSSGSAHNDSPMPSGFDMATSSGRNSPLRSSESREDASSSNQGSCDPPPSSNHSPSPLTWSSPSRPSSLSPSPPEEAQPQAKRQRLCSEVDFARPMPANFLDSLLSSPSPYQTPPRQPEPPLAPNHSPSLESQVVQLLSRVSHLRDCLSHLASRELLLAMLTCFLSSSSTVTHIFKTLSRVFASPHCFQEVINCLIPSKLYEQLYLTPACSPVSLDTSTLFSDELDLSSPVHTLPSPPSFAPRPSLSSTPPPLPRSTAGLGHMCQELLSRLSRVGESPYGQGVLAHLLLTGEEKDKEASALAAPLLCRVARVCQRLMLDYGGQAVLAQLLLVSPSPVLRDMAADSLLALVSTTDHLVHWKLRGLNNSGPAPDVVTAASPTCSIHCPILGSNTPPCLVVSLFHTGMEPGRSARACRYHDSDHCPFDFVVLLQRYETRTVQHGSRTEQTVRLPVHKSVLMEASEVFNVMLGGYYIESGYSEVFLKDIQPQAFRSVLHHMYGCGWLCKEAIADHMVSTIESHDQSCDQQESFNISDSIMAAVSSNFDLPNEHADVLHTLRCLATASQFLLGSLGGECERRAARFLSVTTVVPLFVFSQLHQSCWLAEECVRYVVSQPPSLQRRSCLLELASCAEGTTALDMLQRLVRTQLLTP